MNRKICHAYNRFVNSKPNTLSIFTKIPLNTCVKPSKQDFVRKSITRFHMPRWSYELFESLLTITYDLISLSEPGNMIKMK